MSILGGFIERNPLFNAKHHLCSDAVVLTALLWNTYNLLTPNPTFNILWILGRFPTLSRLRFLVYMFLQDGGTRLQIFQKFNFFQRKKVQSSCTKFSVCYWIFYFSLFLWETRSLLELVSPSPLTQVIHTPPFNYCGVLS